jgi:hypothetical protein
MPNYDIKVEIFNNSEHLGTKHRPVRSTPYGSFGVIFRGEVYPILNLADSAHHKLFVAGRPLVWGIDVGSGDSYFPEVCPLVEREKFKVFEASFEVEDDQLLDVGWYFDHADSRREIFMNGSAGELDIVVDIFTTNNLEISSYGRSVRPASDGQNYNWNIRLSASEEQLPNRHYVRSILQSVFKPHDPITNLLSELADIGVNLTTDGTKLFYRGQISNLSEDIKRHVGKNYQTLVDLQTSVGSLESANTESANTSSGAAHLSVVLDEIIEKLHVEGLSILQGDELRANVLGMFKTEDSAYDVNSSFQGIRKLVQMVGRLQIEFDAILSAKSQLETQTSVALARVEELESKSTDPTRSIEIPVTQSLTELAEKVLSLEVALVDAHANENKATAAWARSEEKSEDLEEENQRLSTSIGRLLKQFESVGETAELVELILFTATPRTTYHMNSIDLLSSFRDPSATLKMIIGLDNRTVSGGKSIGGAPSWREHHVSTGDSNDGRIYYRSDGEKIHVLLGKKQSQKRDIRRLSRI